LLIRSGVGKDTDRRFRPARATEPES
jgi:hypothetical protein